MIPAKHFYMIRHGETEANAAQVMAGSTDSPLTENGRKQAYQAQKIVDMLEEKPARIYHSHLSRARDTALIINEVLNVEMVEDPDLSEICAGDWEGVPWSECMEIVDNWVQGPGGEHPEDFFERIKRGKRKALEDTDTPVLIVCHGGVMRAFGKIHGQNAPALFKNAHLYEFLPAPEKNDFPWVVYDYEFCSETKILKRNLSHAYSSDAEEIAL